MINIKYEAKIYGNDLNDLNDKLIKFLKGKKKLLKGRSIDTIVDESKKLFIAIIRINSETMMNHILDYYNGLEKREKLRFKKRMERFLEKTS